MDSLFGVSGQGCDKLISTSLDHLPKALLLKSADLSASDAQVARSILLYQSDKDKIKALDSHKLLAAAGPQADCNIFGEYIQKNLALYELNNELRLTTAAAANFVRRELATALRSGPYQRTVHYSAPASTYPCYLRTLGCAPRTCSQCPIMQALLLQLCCSCCYYHYALISTIAHTLSANS
eukprot:17653-Heterococcus_DN1.PRE.3